MTTPWPEKRLSAAEAWCTARKERDCTTCLFEDLDGGEEPCLSASRGSNCDRWCSYLDDDYPEALVEIRRLQRVAEYLAAALVGTQPCPPSMKDADDCPPEFNIGTDDKDCTRCWLAYALEETP